VEASSHRQLQRPLVSDRWHTDVLRSEFERTSQTFGERTKGRFDDMGVIEFSRVGEQARVLEVGVGTGNFLSLFDGRSRELIGVDLTPAMLLKARSSFPGWGLVLGDGARLPLNSRSVDLATTAQTLHHIWEPLPVLREMRRVTAESGNILVIDQIAPERFEQAIAMNELEMIRDPSHASSRPPSALRTLLRVAGLRIVEERIVELKQRFSGWMPSIEFPQRRIEKVKEFIDKHGNATGMNFEPVGNDYIYDRKRMMILAERA
jgi:SAM-dependent methyltransferase